MRQQAGAEHVWYSNVVIKNLASRREFDKFSSGDRSAGESYSPDYILTIEPDVDYESSGWNYFVNFPGGIVFAPAWHGYGYYANIMTTVTIFDGDGEQLKVLALENSYFIRRSEFDRTWWPLFSFNALNAVGGIYTALVYDSDITSQVQDAIGENYSEYVTDRIMREIAGLGMGAG